MHNATNLAARLQFIAGLHALADYLAANPAIPVSSHGDQIIVSVNSPEEGGRAQVHHAARLLGATVTDHTRHGGHLYAEKAFGSLIFRVVSIPEACMARHEALWSYEGSVLPNGHTASDA